jgi:hypothetical protein
VEPDRERVAIGGVVHASRSADLAARRADASLIGQRGRYPGRDRDLRLLPRTSRRRHPIPSCVLPPVAFLAWSGAAKVD